MAEDLRKLKDEAARAIEKGKFRRAAEIYDRIAANDPDPQWAQRAGESYQRDGDTREAIGRYLAAADRYGAQGFFPKAQAVCRLVLKLVPDHSRARELMEELDNRRRQEATPGESSALPSAAARLTPPSAEAANALQRFLTPTGMSAANVAASAPESAQEPADSQARPSKETTDPRLRPVTVATKETTDPRLRPPAVPGMPPTPRLTPMRSDGGGIPPKPMRSEGSGMPVAPRLTPTPTSIRPPPAPPRVERTETEIELVEDTPPPPVQRRDRTDATIQLGELDVEMVEQPVSPELPRIPLFAALTPEQITRLATNERLVRVAAGQTIFKSGDDPGPLRIVVSGRVELSVPGRAPEQRIAEVSPGEFFGEASLLLSVRQLMKAKATAPTQLLICERTLIGELSRQAPEMLGMLQQTARQRLIERLIAGSPLFDSLSYEDASALAVRFRFRTFEAGSAIISEGEHAPGLFVILAGDCDVVRNAGSGLGDEKLASLGASEMIGELSLLDRQPAMATVRARTRLWTLNMNRNEFQEVIVTYPQVLIYVSEVADERRKLASTAA